MNDINCLLNSSDPEEIDDCSDFYSNESILNDIYDTIYNDEEISNHVEQQIHKDSSKIATFNPFKSVKSTHVASNAIPLDYTLTFLTPLKLFKLRITDDDIDLIVKNTNEYAKIKINDLLSSCTAWKDTTHQELNIFLL